MTLEIANLTRGDIYITQAFHLLPAERSQNIPIGHVRESFRAITQYELNGQPVIALGSQVSKVCSEEGVRHHPCVHPSARFPIHYKVDEPVEALETTQGG